MMGFRLTVEHLLFCSWSFSTSSTARSTRSICDSLTLSTNGADCESASVATPLYARLIATSSLRLVCFCCPSTTWRFGATSARGVDVCGGLFGRRRLTTSYMHDGLSARSVAFYMKNNKLRRTGEELRTRERITRVYSLVFVVAILSLHGRSVGCFLLLARNVNSAFVLCDGSGRRRQD